MKGDLGQAIIKAACNPKAEEVAVDLAEAGIDQLFDEGLLKEVPILRTIIAFKSVWTGVRDQLFLKKLGHFFAACPTFTDEEREKFAKEHLSDTAKQKKLGEAVVVILEAFNDLEKPKMLAKAFAAFVRGKIPEEAFRRLGAAIDGGFIVDLQALASKHVPGIIEVHFANLLRTGLVEIDTNVDTTNAKVSGTGYKLVLRISVLGKLFIGCMNENYQFDLRE